MTRLIDADALLEEMLIEYLFKEEINHETIKSVITNAPTVQREVSLTYSKYKTVMQCLTKISEFCPPDENVNQLDESPENMIRLSFSEIGDTARCALSALIEAAPKEQIKMTTNELIKLAKQARFSIMEHKDGTNQPIWAGDENVTLEVSMLVGAATTEANKRIAEIESNVELQSSLNKKLYLSFLELQANNNELREALKRASEDLVPHHTKASTYKCVNEAISATPAQSLTGHDNELIERCAKAADSARWLGTDVVLAIRALKGK